ncbi:MAG TPA: DUF1499 domain-containing protein [Gammaproteobacteria bacterium]|nr:DUF1499 domain-containing protein [Gammaproteobacteria bacterium]
MVDDALTAHRAGASPAGRTLTWIGFALAIAGAVMVLVAGPGYRGEFWGLLTAFTMIRWGAYCGGAGAILSLFGTILLFTGHARRWRTMAILGMIFGAIAIGVPWAWNIQAQNVPRIHDITTDTANPPTFDAVLAKRQDARNSATYGGPDVAAQQREAYPDIQPLHLNAPPAAVFKAAVGLIKQNGWTLQAASPATHKIEATATTFWFGFKDDVVIRIQPQGGGSRVDIRSASRIGKSDVGTNAKRVRHFIAQLKNEFG